MKRILKYLLVFISYFIYDIIIKYIAHLFNINYYNLDIKNKIIFTIISSVLYLLAIIIFYRKELLEEIKDFKNNYKKYLSSTIFIYIVGVLLMIITNLILSKLTNCSLSGNEIKVREYIQKFPIYMIYSSIIFAPFVEELIFRKTIRKIFNNKYLFIIISGIIFGILHISNFKDPNEIIFSISYIIMGIDFAYIYYKTNNIFTTITFHLCHNLILLIIQLL